MMTGTLNAHFRIALCRSIKTNIMEHGSGRGGKKPQHKYVGIPDPRLRMTRLQQISARQSALMKCVLRHLRLGSQEISRFTALASSLLLVVLSSGLQVWLGISWTNVDSQWTVECNKSIHHHPLIYLRPEKFYWPHCSGVWASQNFIRSH